MSNTTRFITAAKGIIFQAIYEDYRSETISNKLAVIMAIITPLANQGSQR
jgi:Flp pilus assembly protein protease CpaA